MQEEQPKSILSSQINPIQDSRAPIDFYLAKFRFVIRPIGTMYLPPYKGATLRGGFGYAFKDLVCIKPDRQCETCLILDRCPYFQIFETPVPKGATMMRKYTRAPHPFVLTPPLDERTEYTEKDELFFDLVLIGRAIEYLPYFIYTFEELGRRGIGHHRSKFTLSRVDAFSYDSFPPRTLGGEFPLKSFTIYDNFVKTLKDCVQPITFFDLQRHQENWSLNDDRAQVTLNFLTPVRIWTGGKLDQALNFTDLMKALLRRVQLLQAFHCIQPDYLGAHENSQLTVMEIRRLLKHSESVEPHDKRLKFCDLMRFSTRQRRATPISGFLGKVTYAFAALDELNEYSGYLRLASLVHVGKGTSFGLGKCVLE